MCSKGESTRVPEKMYEDLSRLVEYAIESGHCGSLEIYVIPGRPMKWTIRTKLEAKPWRE